jgi:microcin C transport system permease protein
VPGYVLGALLLLFFSARLDWFPMGGFTSFYFDELGTWDQIKDLFHHAVLPLCCYLVGSFAVTTMLMKNHLMDNLSADYMRTAVAKGVTFEKAVFNHALRNSLIPIATTFGQNITLIVGGSFLIETIFDINGFGLLGLTAIFDRDYPVVMGVVFLSSLLLLIGNILSDFLVAMIDPRIRFR